MATFWERAAYSNTIMISLLCLFVVLVVSKLGFEESYWVLVSPVPDNCFSFSWFHDTLLCY